MPAHRRVTCFRHKEQRQHYPHCTDWQVDKEDPAPVKGLDQKATDDRAKRSAHTPTAPQTPIAAPRFWRGKTTIIIARLTGVSPAAPIPCRARKPISQFIAGAPLMRAHACASAQPREARLNKIMAISNRRLRPYWSAKRPTVIRSSAYIRL